MATTHIDYRKIDYDQLLDKPIIRTDASVDTLTTAGVYDKGDGKRYIVSVNGQNITQVIEEKDGYQTRSSTDGGTTWGAWETVVFSKSGDIDAEDVNYDNTTSELVATNVQAAIDEIDTSVDDVKEDITDIQTDITNIQGDITNIQGDITEIKNIIEVTTMDTPSEDNEGSIVQYKGATNANFTHGYFYECVGDGGNPETFSWVRIDVQPAGAGDEHEFITQAAYDLLTPAQKAAKVYMIKEEGVPGSGLTAGTGIDITNNTISADMSTAVYDNTTSGLTATNVQDAIDEITQGGGTAEDTSYDNTNSGLQADNVQDAIDEVNSKSEQIVTLNGDILIPPIRDTSSATPRYTKLAASTTTYVVVSTNNNGGSNDIAICTTTGCRKKSFEWHSYSTNASYCLGIDDKLYTQAGDGETGRLVNLTTLETTNIYIRGDKKTDGEYIYSKYSSTYKKYSLNNPVEEDSTATEYNAIPDGIYYKGNYYSTYNQNIVVVDSTGTTIKTIEDFGYYENINIFNDKIYKMVNGVAYAVASI